jgi:hypothetical protein
MQHFQLSVNYFIPALRKNFLANFNHTTLPHPTIQSTPLRLSCQLRLMSRREPNYSKHFTYSQVLSAKKFKLYHLNDLPHSGTSSNISA